MSNFFKGFIFVLFFAVFLLNANDSANAFMHFKQGDYLEKKQWGALEDIMADWKSGLITTDECALYGCYILAANEPARVDKIEKLKLVPSKYKLNKKSSEAGPYFFIYFLYKNEEAFGKQARDEFYSSDWCEEKYLENIYSNPAVDEALKKLFSLPLGEIENIMGNRDDFFDVMKYLADQKLISYETVVIAFESAIRRSDKFINKFYDFNKKFNLKVKKGDFVLIGKLIRCIANTQDRKAINIINFYNNYTRLLSLYGYKINLTISGNEFVVIGDAIECEIYKKIIEHYYSLLCDKNGYKKPINFVNNQNLKVTLDPGASNDFGVCVPIFNNENINVIDAFEITFYVKSINDAKAVIPKEKIVIHELFHTIQYSYVDKVKPFYWYSADGEYFVFKFTESTATWAEDYFYDLNDKYKNILSTIYNSASYFFRAPFSPNTDFSFSACGFGHSSGDKYCLGFFWNDYCNQYGKDSIKLMFESLPTIKASELLANKTNFIDTYHNFAVKNFLINKQIGIDSAEDLFRVAPTTFKPLHSDYPELKIHDDKLSTTTVNSGVIQKHSFTFHPWSSQMFKIASPKNYFENSVIMKFTNQKGIKISVVEAWTLINSNDAETGKINYSVKNLENIDSYSYYRYYTKKGINPKYFIIVATHANSDNDFSDKKIDVEISVDKPFESIGDSIAVQINEAGERFKNDIVSIFSKNSISNMNALDSQICKLYDDYSKTKNEFTANQIIQKIRDLNLMMQTCMVAVHDLRYQYYLYKNSCIDKIIAGASPQSVIKQVEKLKTFIDDIKIDDYNTSVNVANAYIIWNHAHLKLKSIKEIDPEEWDMGQATYDKINKISKIITGNSKYPYWYSNAELQEAISSPFIGIPEDELPGPVFIPGYPTKGPFPVNYCPGIKRQLDSLKIPYVYNISSKLKSISITINNTTYNASNMLCVRDKFDPLSLTNFSAIKKHRYHEDNMPPVPSVSNIRSYVSLLSYYMKICKNFSLCNNEELSELKKIMVGGASERIMEIVVLISEAVIKEKQQNKDVLYDNFKLVASESEFYNEMLDLTEKQLARDRCRELD